MFVEVLVDLRVLSKTFEGVIRPGSRDMPRPGILTNVTDPYMYMSYII